MEIEMATKVKRSLLNGRRKRLGFPANRKGYTLEEIKRMLKKPPHGGNHASRRKAEKLKELLVNDGAINP